MENQKKILLAFDFDHTLIDENSDLSVKKLAPNGQLPESIEAQYSATGWTEYMAAIFKYLHSIGWILDGFISTLHLVYFLLVSLLVMIRHHHFVYAIYL